MVTVVNTSYRDQVTTAECTRSLCLRDLQIVLILKSVTDMNGDFLELRLGPPIRLFFGPLKMSAAHFQAAFLFFFRSQAT
jgi:hypothetical protein